MCGVDPCRFFKGFLRILGPVVMLLSMDETRAQVDHVVCQHTKHDIYTFKSKRHKSSQTARWVLGYDLYNQKQMLGIHIWPGYLPSGLWQGRI